MAEILATNEDVNSNLEGVDIVEANDGNTALLQINVARMVRAYLSRTFSQSVLQSWNITDNDTESVPDTIRSIAGMLIASQLYFNQTAGTTAEVDDRHFSMVLYNRALAMLDGIVSGAVVIPGIDETPEDQITSADFWPNSDTDRAFTLSKKFY